MDGRGKSDGSVLPGKLPNKAGQPAAEAVEGRGPTKGNSPERNALRTQSRAGAPSALERVRQVAEKDRRQASTARRGSTTGRNWRLTSGICPAG